MRWYKKLTVLEWIEKARQVHGEKFDYNKVIYVNNQTPVIICCRGCGCEFFQSPNSHLSGYGCKKCAGLEKLNTEIFIERAILIHGDKFGYERSVYTNYTTKVLIYCRKCGVFFMQTPASHLQGQGCQECGRKYTGEQNKKDVEDFIRQARSMHGDRFDYSRVVYVNSKTDVIIICRTCGEVFLQTPAFHLNRCGCPECAKKAYESNGANLVRSILEKTGVLYIREKRFDGCKDKNKLRFDFYLPGYEMCIEYHGGQHYKPVPAWGGEKGLEVRQRHDEIKRIFCQQNQIKLLEIRYDCKDIENEILRFIQ